MIEEPISPLGPLELQRTHSIGKEVAYDQGIERLECEHNHVYKQCESCWNTIEPKYIPPVKIIQKPTWRQKYLPRKMTFRWYHWIILGFLIAIAIALAVVFRPRQPFGVYRHGTGLVALDRGDDSSMVDIFFQHESGDIRHLVLDDNTEQWSAGSLTDNVLNQNAPKPRQGTPLMAVSYTIDLETTWRVFYIDFESILQESIASTMTSDFPTQWIQGPLGLSRLKAHTSPHTGISACKNMLWSSDTSGFNNGSLVLLYGGGDGLNHMLTREVQDTVWTSNYTFQDSMAESGIECTVRGSNILDTWMIDPHSQLLQSSFNFDPSSNDTIYLAGQWTNGVVYNNTIATPTSISAIKYTGNSTIFASNSTFVYFSTPNGIIAEVNIDTYNRTHLPLVVSDSQSVNSLPAMNQTKIASVSLRTDVRNPMAQQHGQESKVFLQFEDNLAQISMMTGNFYEGWMASALGDGIVSEIGR